ncbi:MULTISPECIES: hypothetical protein [unclassified Bradyrhizobium]|uniref:hypothetical protein n=1 Tax=unclassified Bradyrhizobium TaxID=2631580 RepID=UPI0014044167|nr:MULTISPECIES: hypothetical protein [unclassified Bradyrhizobium]
MTGLTSGAQSSQLAGTLAKLSAFYFDLHDARTVTIDDEGIGLAALISLNGPR